jgi:tryptophan 2,3-dioxygenase
MRWNEINNWAKKLKISTGIFAKFVGYSFVKNSKNQDYRKIYSINELYKILEKLLDLEASIKIFDSKSHFVSFIEYLHYDLQR